MGAALSALFSSRKFLLVAVAVFTCGTLVAVGKLPVSEFVETTKLLIGVLVAAIAAEDYAQKRDPSPLRPAPPAPPPLAAKAAVAAVLVLAFTWTPVLTLPACSALGPQSTTAIATTIDGIACKELEGQKADPIWIELLCPDGNGGTARVRMRRLAWSRMNVTPIDAGPGL